MIVWKAFCPRGTVERARGVPGGRTVTQRQNVGISFSLMPRDVGEQGWHRRQLDSQPPRASIVHFKTRDVRKRPLQRQGGGGVEEWRVM